MQRRRERQPLLALCGLAVLQALAERTVTLAQARQVAATRELAFQEVALHSVCLERPAVAPAPQRPFLAKDNIDVEVATPHCTCVRFPAGRVGQVRANAPKSSRAVAPRLWKG